MAIFKCKMCGGDLNVQEGITVCECEYCGTKQTVPMADNEKKVNAFNRANHLRSSCEFDKAAGVYESIVSEFPEESEAYWGLCLCKFGIEYVDDPASGKKIPTCHRTSYDSIFEDSNFEQELEWADSVAHSVYRAEAKEIDRLQKEILEIAKNEQPFDVFICYKESDENGQRTVDSELAHDIYDVLTEKGYKVFYSRITLKAKLGQDYEPYIFSALNSAKVMLAIGTKYEYYNAVWVKNEWSRYLALMSKDSGKTLIPCYRDIDAYDMPKEFKHLQAQDLNSPRAFQDLVNNIEKIIPKSTNDQSNMTVQQPVIMPSSLTVEPLLKRAFMCLEDEDWIKADELFEQVLNHEPENARAYVGKLMIDLKISRQEQLGELEKNFESNNNYQKAIKFGNSDIQNELCTYINTIHARKQLRIDFINCLKKLALVRIEYKKAVDILKSAQRAEDYDAVKRILMPIKGFKDSAQLIEKCYYNIYNEAIYKMKFSRSRLDFITVGQMFRLISGYKDSDELAKQCDEYENYEYYNNAITAMKNNDYSRAEKHFSLTNGFKDSDELVRQCREMIKKQKINEQEEEEKLSKLLAEERLKYDFRSNGLCQYCGGTFKGVIKKICSNCGKPKDY